jgi:hypothetical protein
VAELSLWNPDSLTTPEVQLLNTSFDSGVTPSNLRKGQGEAVFRVIVANWLAMSEPQQKLFLLFCG